LDCYTIAEINALHLFTGEVADKGCNVGIFSLNALKNYVKDYNDKVPKEVLY